MVIPAFVEIGDELPDAILNSFEPVFIGVQARNGKGREPIFPIHFGNVGERVEVGLPRKNNHVSII